MKLKTDVFANTAAVWTAGVYLFCRLGITFFPKLARLVTASWFHGIDLDRVWSMKSLGEGFILGLVSTVAFAWVFGWLFAYLYNSFSGKK